MSAHTPGPWSICVDPPNDYWYAGVTIGAADPSDARRVCDVFTGGATGDDIQPMHKANASLIAAAPDLLEALIEARNDLRSLLHGCSYDQRIDAAIAKATGELK